MKSFPIDLPNHNATSEPPVRANSAPSPRRSAWQFALFRKYVRRYLRHHFHAVRVSQAGPLPGLLAGPLVVVANHPSWWDPLVGLVFTELMHEKRVHYCPFDVHGLAQYPFLKRLGCFGVEVGTPRGGLAFLRQCQAILSRPESVLWITPQGEFVDPRQRPVGLKQGIGHLAYRLSEAMILPMALEYPFWNDRCPEALARFGEPIKITASGSETPRAWTTRIETALEKTQDQLAEEARRRDPRAFLSVVEGTSGVGGIYDKWRRLRTAIRGETFYAEHRTLNGPPSDREWMADERVYPQANRDSK
jgi:1-acyl-sn-glycerol-3-phosphate acyltransferase